MRSSRPMWWWLLLLISLWPAGLVSAPQISAGTAAVAPESSPAEGEDLRQPVPQKVREVLKRVLDRQGEPLPGYVGGRIFHNRAGRLPRGRYREYDVNPSVRGRPRDAERIVIEQRTHKAYYTPDHYRTFIPLN